MGCNCKKKRVVKTSEKKGDQDNAEKPKRKFSFPGL